MDGIHVPLIRRHFLFGIDCFRLEVPKDTFENEDSKFKNGNVYWVLKW